MILHIGNTSIVLEPGSVKLTYSVNDIGNPSKRDGAYSDSFNLPKTKETSEALGYPDNFNVFADDVSPYKKIPCSISEGQDIIRGFAQVTASEKFYKIDVYGDNVNWFDILKSRQLSDLDFSDLEHRYTDSVIRDSWTHTEGYTYPLIDYGLLGAPVESGQIIPGAKYKVNGTGFIKYNGTNYNVGDTFIGVLFEDKFTINDSPNVYRINVLLVDFYFAVFYHTIVKKIFNEAGYKIAGDFIKSPFYRRMLIPFNNKEFKIQTARDAKATVTESHTYNVYPLLNGTPDFIPLSEKITLPNDEVLPGYHQDFDNYDGTLSRYTADADILLSITTVIYFNPPPVGTRPIFTISKNSPKESPIPFTPNFGFPLTSGVELGINEIHLLAGEFIEFNFLLFTADPSLTSVLTPFTIGLGSYWEIKEVSGSPVNGLVTINNNIADLTQGDVINSLFNQFQLITFTNEYTKTVYFELADKITKNIPDAEDWSDLLDLTNDPEIEFSVDGYGKLNNFKYSDSEDEIEKQEYNNKNTVKFGDGQSRFDNETLENEKDIVELPFASTIQHKSLNADEKYTYLPSITLGSDPRVLIWVGTTPLTDVGTNEIIEMLGEWETQIPYAYFDKPAMGTAIDSFSDSLSFGTPAGYSSNGLLENYFPPIKNLVERPKVLTALFRLKATHIRTLDFLLPKFIDRYKSYFYLNSVNEYSGEEYLTECQLVKISLKSNGAASGITVTDAPSDGFILTEDGDYILTEDGGRIPIE